MRVLQFMVWLVPAAQVAFGIPLMLKMVKPNHFYGIRTAQTLASSQEWYQQNKLLGVALCLAGIAALGITAAILRFYSGAQESKLILCLGCTAILVAISTIMPIFLRG